MHWWRSRNREEDLEREIRNDLDLEAAEQQARGLTAEEARHAAQRAFGNVALTKEEVRTMWGWTTWDILVQDVRYAIRSLRRSPGFTATAFLTLALGIGASTAVFTIVDSVLLRPLPYHESGRLVALFERVRFLSGEPVGPNPRHVDVWRKRATAFAGLALVQQMAQGITLGSGHPRLFGTVICSANLFDLLEVQPFLGRAFVPEDDVPGSDAVAMITYSLWQSIFHGDRDIIGKTIHVANVPRRIVGVLPPRFYFPGGTELRSFRRAGRTINGALEPAVFFPAALDVSKFAWNGNYGNWVALGRLHQGVSVNQAESQLNTIQTQIVQELPADRGDHRPGALLATAQPLQEAIVSDSRMGLWFLLCAVLGLTLMACVNLASAQLGRASRRSI